MKVVVIDLVYFCILMMNYRISHAQNFAFKLIFRNLPVNHDKMALHVIGSFVAQVIQAESWEFYRL